MRAVVGVWTDSAGRDLLGDLGDMWVGPSHPGAPWKVTGGAFVAAPPARSAALLTGKPLGSAGSSCI